MRNKENDDRHKNELNVMALQAWDHRSGRKHGYWMKQQRSFIPGAFRSADFDAMKNLICAGDQPVLCWKVVRRIAA